MVRRSAGFQPAPCRPDAGAPAVAGVEAPDGPARGCAAGGRVGNLSYGLGFALCLTLTAAYAFRPDAFAAVTVFPHWVWLVPGLFSAVVPRWLGRPRAAATLAGLWVLFGLAFVDAPLALVRPVFADGGRADDLRVVSLNCAGSGRAAGGLIPLRPDVVLLQESPGRDVVDRVAEELFGKNGGVAWGPDCTVIARGTVTAIPPAAGGRGDFTHAAVTTPDGRRFGAVSLRLEPSPARVDLWNPACWSFRTRERRARRRQLAAIVHEVATAAGDVPLLVGGDFNCPAGDGALPPLTGSPRLFHETFADAGRGWGHTFLAGFPVLRIDQVWCDAGFEPVSSRAVRVPDSDHRAVLTLVRGTP